MERFQLWLPKLGRSTNFSEVRRDAQRAFEEWRGELEVWLLPGLKEVVRWNEPPILGVPTEELDLIHVFHVGTAGTVFGLGAKHIFPNMNVHGLLDAWLNHGNFDFVSYAPISMVVPRLIADDHIEYIEYKEQIVDFEPGPTLPFNNIGEAQGGKHVDFRWPGEGLPATVAPEAEIEVFNGPRKAGVHQGQPVAIGHDGQMALRMMLRWHPPLTNLMPHLSSWDDMYSQARMRKIAEQSTVDGPGALRDATNLAKDYCSEGVTTKEMAWFHTTLQEKGVGPLIFEAETFGLTMPGSLRHKGGTHPTVQIGPTSILLSCSG
jgi:hypothetical protein